MSLFRFQVRRSDIFGDTVADGLSIPLSIQGYCALRYHDRSNRVNRNDAPSPQKRINTPRHRTPAPERLTPITGADAGSSGGWPALPLYIIRDFDQILVRVAYIHRYDFSKSPDPFHRSLLNLHGKRSDMLDDFRYGYFRDKA